LNTCNTRAHCHAISRDNKQAGEPVPWHTSIQSHSHTHIQAYAKPVKHPCTVQAHRSIHRSVGTYTHINTYSGTHAYTQPNIEPCCIYSKVGVRHPDTPTPNLTDRLTYINKHTQYIHTHRQTYTGRQTDKQIVSPTHRQSYIHTHMQTKIQATKAGTHTYRHANTHTCKYRQTEIQSQMYKQRSKHTDRQIQKSQANMWKGRHTYIHTHTQAYIQPHTKHAKQKGRTNTYTHAGRHTDEHRHSARSKY